MDSGKVTGRKGKEKSPGEGRRGGRLRDWLQRDAKEVLTEWRETAVAGEGDSHGGPAAVTDTGGATAAPGAAAVESPGAAGIAGKMPVDETKPAPAGEGRAPAGAGAGTKAAGERRPLPPASAAARLSLADRGRAVLSEWWRSLREAVKFSARRFPVGLTDRERLETLPPLASTWYRFLLVVIGGSLTWTLITALLQRRVMWVSILVAFIVAVGVVASLGTRFGVPVGVLATAMALLSLVVGELTVQMLYRFEVIKELDVAGLGRAVDYVTPFYRAFYYRLVVYRLLPSAVVSFLVGLWPLPSRFCWKGFGTRG